ncbi:DUF862-domain-containing protein [Rozella allomycis CSF55]|uniref:DUF862-domain-containing protein n=1 Tax=Rozella allomycis (strain CSF55) TaxID=988480 RepID=A0A4P9YQQ8_ROZAC|nr:DUF862-domain-containing protein [Rozella allomycis CSF55]
MYTLFKGLYSLITQREEYNILIIGIDNAGKTTLLEKIKSRYSPKGGLPPEKIVPTIGLNFANIFFKGYKLHFWDLGGQEEIRRLWTTYYKECHGVFFVIDSTDKSRLMEVQNSFESLILHHEADGVPVILIANKQDKGNSMKIVEIKEVFNKIAMVIDARESTVLDSPSNHFLYRLGLGVYHTGVELMGTEYCFGGHPYKFSGVFETVPRVGPPGVFFRESIFMGYIEKDDDDIVNVIRSIMIEYSGKSYNLLKRNCNHFSEDLVYRLTDNKTPRWINRLAYIGSWFPCLVPDMRSPVESEYAEDERAPLAIVSDSAAVRPLLPSNSTISSFTA